MDPSHYYFYGNHAVGQNAVAGTRMSAVLDPRKHWSIRHMEMVYRGLEMWFPNFHFIELTPRYGEKKTEKYLKRFKNGIFEGGRRAFGGFHCKGVHFNGWLAFIRGNHVHRYCIEPFGMTVRPPTPVFYNPYPCILQPLPL